MATVKDLVSRIIRIDGIQNYILVREDGHTVSHNYAEDSTLASVITFCGLNSETIKSVIGATYFRNLAITMDSDEKLLVFPLGRYFLGIFHKADAYTPDVVSGVESAIASITQRKQI